MNAEVFAKGLEKCRLLSTLLGENVENLDDYGCPKIQDLVKTDSLWICSSYPFRQKTRLHCAERKAKVYGEWAMQHLQILYVFFVFVFTTNLNLSSRRDFFSFWEIELTKQLTDQEDNINLGKIVFDDNNQERKSWACLGQTCSRSLIVFFSQLFFYLLIIFGCFWRIHLSKTCDESTVSVGILCSAAGNILPSPRLWTS